MEDDSDDNIVPSVEETERLAEYPDSSRANRRPPISRSMPHEISCKYDVKVLCISGDYICTSSSVTKVWSVSSGTCVGVISHENFRITAMGFKPSRNLEEEGRFIWLGTKEGGLLEGDLGVMRVTSKRLGVHTTAIKGIYRCGFEMWTLDEDGRVQIWGPDAVTDGLPNLAGSPKSQRGPSALQAGIVVRDQLWIGRNKAISVFKPSAAAEQTQFALSRPIAAARPVGEISCAAILTQDPEHVYFGHDDGKISVYSVSKMTCVDVVSISIYKVTAMAGVGNNLWIGFRTGMIYVYDVSQRPWVVLKDWKAHEGPVMSLMVDRSSIFKMKRLPVVTMTHSDNVLTIWDGMLRHDWLERNMQEHDTEFCSFRAIRTLVCTWNVGAAKPADLQSKSTDSKFLKRLLAEADDPEIIVFGFQELVELDNKTVTAKSIFKKKKHKDKDNIQQHMSHQYQAWQTRLEEVVATLPSSYYLLRSENLVGLYSCIFVKEVERSYIRNLNSSTVKTGLGGLHGNKGAIILRFTLDDTSLCFVNCHLAAGQSHIIPRNNDIANIMECKIPSPRMGSTEHAADIFVGGGDGTMILDHELCFINGDMNYRINLHRLPVMKMLEKGEIDKLLEFDQLLNQLKRNPGFRLRPFSESPITFKPTYKYDIGTNNYDTSEKKRTPAWCDRIYYRGPGKITPINYRTHEVCVSDHRPVSGIYDINIKTVDKELRQEALTRASQRWDKFVEKSVTQAR
ncbi:Endonuclease/exonuclease/phosphatase [Kockiozyma suomiensis]|uniref:Endonuclease/exonuclease/phosphatase n=1 Tax=Kockiozyma suomiensis TaxID=1337062 RepID=UPI0033435DF2